MRPFSYQTAADADQAVRAASVSGAAFLAGGTGLLDLMKLDVMRPRQVVDINRLAGQHAAIRADAPGLSIGALARMSDVAAHPDVARQYPVIAQSLLLAASSQLRNMASIGGNVLQRTRCSYFRDTSWAACNKREPGSGCAAIGGVNRQHAVLGVSEHCIASYPGDLAAALIALDASVAVQGPGGARTVRFAELHRRPGATPELETTLEPGELITAFQVPAGPHTARSLYLKVRDRESYAFAAASAAVALDIQDGIVRDARVALGGVATTPWRSVAAEQVLRGQTLDEATAVRAAVAAFEGAHTSGGNDFKPELGRRTLTRALLQARDMRA